MDNAIYEQNEDLQTVKEVAKRLKVSESTVYNLLKSQQLDGYRVGRSWRIPAKNVDKYLQNNTILRYLEDQEVK
ncbi:MAG: helix-turn-helix domain-containing protein [Firmicutes bacterium]|nr:helix-turn-helix domain-containing protein [Bacillota bacterium]